MTVKELIDKLKMYPDDTVVTFNYKEVDDYYMGEFFKEGDIVDINFLEDAKYLELYIK